MYTEISSPSEESTEKVFRCRKDSLVDLWSAEAKHGQVADVLDEHLLASCRQIPPVSLHRLARAFNGDRTKLGQLVVGGK